MDIIAKSVPLFDETNPNRSMQEFRNYMVQTLELIDYTLSTQGTVVRGAVSEENFSVLAQQVAALASSLVSLQSIVSEHTNKLEDHEKRIEALEQK